jgi:hypothetical protein
MRDKGAATSAHRFNIPRDIALVGEKPDNDVKSGAPLDLASDSSEEVAA